MSEISATEPERYLIHFSPSLIPQTLIRCPVMEQDFAVYIKPPPITYISLFCTWPSIWCHMLPLDAESGDGKKHVIGLLQF